MKRKTYSLSFFLLLLIGTQSGVLAQAPKKTAILPLEINIIDKGTEEGVPHAEVIIWRYTDERDSIPVDTLESNGMGSFQCFLMVDEPTLFSFAVKSPQHSRQHFKVLAGPKSSNWQSKRNFTLDPYERSDLSHLRRIGFEFGTLNYFPKEEFESLKGEIAFLKRYLERQVRGNEIEQIELIASTSQDEMLSFGDSLPARRLRQVYDYLVDQGIPKDILIMIPQSPEMVSWIQGRVGGMYGNEAVFLGIKYAEPKHLRPKQ